MTRMGQFDVDPEAPAVHVWTGEEDLPWFVPLRVEEYALAASMPPDVVRSRSRGMRVRKLKEPDWKLVRGDTAVVRGDIDPEGLKAAAVYAQEMNVMLRSHLGGVGDSGLFSIRLFAESMGYRRAAARAGAANAESYYDPRSAEMVLWFGGYPTPGIFQRAFAHEFAHAWIDRVWKRTEPLWFMEGLAEWFSNLDWRGDILVPGQMNHRALFILKLQENSLLSLKDLFGLGREAMYGVNFMPLYAQSWTVADYIMTRMPYGAAAELLNTRDFAGLEAQEPEYRAHLRMMMSGIA